MPKMVEKISAAKEDFVKKLNVLVDEFEGEVQKAVGEKNYFEVHGFVVAFDIRENKYVINSFSVDCPDQIEDKFNVS